MYVKVKVSNDIKDLLSNQKVGMTGSNRWWEHNTIYYVDCDGGVLSSYSEEDKDKIIMTDKLNYFLVERIYQDDNEETDSGFEVITKPEFLESALEFLINKVILKK